MDEYRKEDILEIAKSENIQYIRLQFSDILGSIKSLEMPINQLEKALDGEVMFDGSSIEGFVDIEESDMFLKPDLDTWMILPWFEGKDKMARLVCDIYTTEGEPFEGDPRSNLKRILQEMEDMGFDQFNLGPEPEFFLFKLDSDNNATLNVNDNSGYFDLDATDTSSACRREIARTLNDMGFEIEMFHHEGGPSQHEISFKYQDALRASDFIQTFKLVSRVVAKKYGLHVTFMPKPLHKKAGNGMHYNVSLFKDGKNVFYDADDEDGLSETMKHFMAGILEHARGFTAICNPLVNSYKRLQSGHEAPKFIAWSGQNRTPLMRIPATRGPGTRAEVRSLDPSANPYLATAVILKAGLSGIENELDLASPVDENLYEMSRSKLKAKDIEDLPTTLYTAIKALDEDTVIQAALGDHIYNQFRKNKIAEWNSYSAQITEWEIENYLNHY